MVVQNLKKNMVISTEELGAAFYLKPSSPGPISRISEWHDDQGCLLYGEFVSAECLRSISCDSDLCGLARLCVTAR